MKVVVILFMLFSLSFGSDATIEVIKKIESLPALAVEDASISYDDTFKMKFFKALVSDLNVLSLFNVERKYNTTKFDAGDVVIENKNMQYVLRYKLFEDDNGALNVELKLFKDNATVLVKNYKISANNVYMFVSHAIAYDINEFMGAPSVEWMKKKVIFSRMVDSKKSEIVISDYTLEYQHVVVKGGFNIFPKWANKQQDAFYYTSLDSTQPTLKKVDVASAKVISIISSDGMLVCSDVSDDSKKLLLTMAPKGQPDIYLYDIEAKTYKRITTYAGIDVNGQFMNDNKIAFISNRLGHPNVFSKVIDSNTVEQMVYYGNSNSSCSSHGEYLVYKARESSNAFSANTFNLHLISTKTDFIRRLTATGNNEFPRFSKDGDAILFVKNYKEQSSIGIIRLLHNKNYLFPLKYGKIQAIDW
ncbi:Tol-Pal system protein TolB [bacterium]|nr:Tol-Pal system protein TolB [bacterium]MBU1994645.1 Tol-Pal system protein TolB [bacterium]